MSLDFVLVKGKTLVSSLAELEQDESFGAGDYQALAKSLYPIAVWESGETGHATANGVSVELHVSDSSLSLWCRGTGDIITHVNHVAIEVHRQGLVVIDVQSSEIVAPEKPNGDPAYVQWYRDVIANARG